MTEESTNALVASEKTGLDDSKTSKICNGNSGSLNKGVKTHVNHRRASVGSVHIGEASRNNLNEKSETAMNLQNIGSRYLRASTGSCHDHCKYGNKSEVQEKPWKPLRRRSEVALPHEPFVHIVVSGEKKKESFIGRKSSMRASNPLPTIKPSPDTKPNLPKSRTSLDANTLLSRQNASSVNNMTLPPKHSPLPVKRSPSHDPPEVIKREITSSTEVEAPAKMGSSTDTKTGGTKNKKVDNNEKCSSPVHSKSIEVKSPTSSEEKTDRRYSIHPSPEKSKSVTVHPSSSSDSSDVLLGIGKRAKAPAKNSFVTGGKISRPENVTDYHSRKSSSSVKPTPVNVKLSTSSDSSGGGNEKVGKSSKVKPNRKIAVPIAATKKALLPSIASLTRKLSRSKIASIEAKKSGSAKIGSHLKARNKVRKAETKTIDNDVVVEKTLHVIKTETGNNVLESVSDDRPMSVSRAKVSSNSPRKEVNQRAVYSGKKADKGGSFIRQTTEIGRVQSVKVNSPRKKIVPSEDRYRSPMKVKFRSGKVADLRSDNNSPKRLRFRNTRAVGAEEGKGDLRRRIFKKAGGHDDAVSAEPSSQKVVLKHQDVQVKNAQCLLNNMIEETASKLVASKKSKVKALVGAFETVISLQEIKPSSHTAH